MTEFLELLSPSEAIKIFLENYHHRPISERIETIHALNRVTSDPVLAPHPLPMFVRSTVDGYAVKAKDTYGASESLPAYMKITGEVEMGKTPEFDIGPHECALIHTGGMLPNSANAVVMIEYTQIINSQEVEIFRSVAPNENVILVGEDISHGQELFQSGTCLKPADIGGLLALGITEISVSKKPRVGIISSGDELVNPDVDVAPGQIRDINSYSLSALIELHAGVPIRYGIVPDDFNELLSTAKSALNEMDMLIFTAGSSVSTRDLTAKVINNLGLPGVLAHGVNIRPGKPTILAVCAGKPVVGLPGNPVSALIIAERFILPVLDLFNGLSQKRIRPKVRARLSINLSSQSGREDWVPVRLIRTVDYFIAEPIFGKSNLIFTLSHADGLVCIQADANGINAGEYIDVYLF